MRGGYNYKRKEVKQSARPQLIAGVDGESEANFIHAQFQPTHTITIVEQAKALSALIDAVEAALARSTAGPRVGVVLTDIETTGDDHLRSLERITAEALERGVNVYFNAPHFEATMLRYHQPVPVNMPKSEIERLLQLKSETVGLPYKKPESIAYHRDFAQLQLQDQFQKHCIHTHQQIDLPCLCKMFADLAI